MAAFLLKIPLIFDDVEDDIFKAGKSVTGWKTKVTYVLLSIHTFQVGSIKSYFPLQAWIVPFL